MYARAASFPASSLWVGIIVRFNPKIARDDGVPGNCHSGNLNTLVVENCLWYIVCARGSVLPSLPCFLPPPPPFPLRPLAPSLFVVLHV